MTEEQTQKLQNLLDHIKSNAIEIIDNQRVSNTHAEVTKPVGTHKK